MVMVHVRERWWWDTGCGGGDWYHCVLGVCGGSRCGGGNGGVVVYLLSLCGVGSRW